MKGTDENITVCIFRAIFDYSGTSIERRAKGGSRFRYIEVLFIYFTNTGVKKIFRYTESSLYRGSLYRGSAVV